MAKYTLNDVYAAYIRLYGADKRDEISEIIEDAKRIAASTGDDVILTAEAMLNDQLN